MRRALILASTLFAAASQAAEPGEETYRLRCGLCHESGATNAPRRGDAAAWAARAAKGRPALHHSALRGVPDTAMLPKAGFPELGDAEVIAATDYLLSGLVIRETSVEREQPRTGTTRSKPNLDDDSLVIQVANALRARLAPQSDVHVADGVTRVSGIRIEAKAGLVTLSGMLGDVKAVRQAEAIAQDVIGVGAVVNRLVSAEIFEHD